jgi:formylglycine-generating enzyme
MSHPLFLIIISLILAPLLAAAPVVTDVRVAQIPGTHQVRITYNFTASGPCTVKVQAWLENPGTSLVIPAAALTGDVTGDDGVNKVSPGTGKSITLTVAKTNPDGTHEVKAPALQNTFTKNLRFKVLATESSGPVNYGDMAQIAGGPFQMGDQSNPLVGYSDERPVHTVQVSTFYMAKYEVTKELWDEVRAWVIANGRGYDLAVGNGSYASKGVNHPVHSITWYDMVKWCNARSEKENLTPCYTVAGLTYKTGQNSAVFCNFAANGYRLPTEAEWEKAARGGASGKNFPWGTDTISHQQANYRASSSSNYDLSGAVNNYHPTWSNNNNGVYPYSSPVGTFAPDPVYGLYDMAGNMREWCWDWYGSYTAGSQTDPRGPASGSDRVGRGGGWFNYAISCRAANRSSNTPTSTNFYIGFRIARSSVP